MAKKVTGFIKLQIEAGKANPSPPIGPALGQKGVNIMEFCKAFNAKTQKNAGMILPTIITVYSDRSFSFVTKTPPASWFLKNKLKLKSGSSKPGHEVAGKQTSTILKNLRETASVYSKKQKSGSYRANSISQPRNSQVGGNYNLGGLNNEIVRSNTDLKSIYRRIGAKSIEIDNKV